MEDGARNVTGGTDGGRATTYRNSLLQVRGATQRFQAGVKTCRICKSKVSQDANYCQECAHHNGICAMCGKRVDDLRFDRRGGVKPEKRKEPQGFAERLRHGRALRKKAKAPEESEEAPPSVPQEDPEVVARRERDARAQASALGAADAALNRARNRVVGAEPAAAAPAPAPAPAGRGRGATTPAWMSRAPAPAACLRRLAVRARRDVGQGLLLQRKNAADVADLAARRRRRRPRAAAPNNNERGQSTRSPPAPRRRRSPPTAWRCGTRRSASRAHVAAGRGRPLIGSKRDIGGGLEGYTAMHFASMAERGGESRPGPRVRRKASKQSMLCREKSSLLLASQPF